jgi:pSer/pThr/pTyr-binding forkhead associated (FHA) protein
MNNETRPLEDSLIFNQNSKFILSLLNEEVRAISWFLTNGIHKIGRIPDKQIILDDVTVSRHHGFITVDDEEISIDDEQSTNGIFINGELLTESVLKSGDRIQIGKYSLIVTKTE